jgi:hypothetical protein
MKFFENFPRIATIQPNGVAALSLNLMTRVNLVPSLLNNPAIFYKYTMQEGDLPEIVSTKYYDDPYRYWIFLYGNQTIDPQWDLGLSSENFKKYLIDKYTEASKNPDTGIYFEGNINGTTLSITNFFSDGRIISKGEVITGEGVAAGTTIVDFLAGTGSTGTYRINIPQTILTTTTMYADVISWTKSTVKYYRKLVTTVDSLTNVTTVNAFNVDEETYNNLPENLVTVKSFPSDPISGIVSTVTTTISKDTVSIYDYEDQLNDSKKEVNIVNKSYSEDIENRLKSLLEK